MFMVFVDDCQNQHILNPLKANIVIFTCLKSFVSSHVYGFFDVKV